MFLLRVQFLKPNATLNISMIYFFNVSSNAQFPAYMQFLGSMASGEHRALDVEEAGAGSVATEQPSVMTIINRDHPTQIMRIYVH